METVVFHIGIFASIVTLLTSSEVELMETGVSGVGQKFSSLLTSSEVELMETVTQCFTEFVFIQHF